MAAISRLLSRTFFPLSNMIGFNPNSINLSAANNPAGPLPMTMTRLLFFFNLGKIDVSSNEKSWSLLYKPIFTSAFIFLFLASNEIFSIRY